jgi:putative ABC transport system permease protein
MTLCADKVDNYRRPLGFTYDNVWHISRHREQRLTPTSTREHSIAVRQEDSTVVRQVYLTLQDFDEIEAAGGTESVPFSWGRGDPNAMYNGRRVSVMWSRVTDEFKDVLGLRIVHGRWFERTDDALDGEAVVITQKLSQELFGSEDPLGKKIIPSFPHGAEWYVVGVISDYRQDEFNSSQYYKENFLFVRINWKRAVGSDYFFLTYLIKVRPETTAAFEEKLTAKLRAVARDQTFEITPLSQIRASAFKGVLTGLMVIGIVAASLMIMVGLGLVGILWQNVTQRTEEIGLRKASGATDGEIYKQILGELLVITSVGVVIITTVLLQFPLFEVIGVVTSWRIYIYGLVISCILLYGLVILCGLYPSWLATRIHPAEALHYE